MESTTAIMDLIMLRALLPNSALPPTLLCLIFAFATSPLQAATEISPGVLYQPGSQLKVSSLGLQLTIPENWQAVLPAGSEALVMEPTGQTARMIVTAAGQSSAQTVQALMSQPQVLDAMTQLQPVGQLSQQAGIYAQQFKLVGNNPQNLKASAYGRLGSNQTALFVIMLEPQNQNLLAEVGRKFIQSVKFNRPQASVPANADGNQNIDWDQALRGRTLQYLKTNNGLSVDKRMNLCSDGSFFYSDNDSYVSSDAISDFSGSSQSSNAGRWNISGDQIKLAWNDGSTSQFTLSRRYVREWGEWGTFVDDERWFNNRNRVCN